MHDGKIGVERKEKKEKKVWEIPKREAERTKHYVAYLNKWRESNHVRLSFYIFIEV